MKILFLDQSGQPGGAELCLLDIAKCYGDRACVCLLADGPFRELLSQAGVPVRVLAATIAVQKESGLLTGLASLGRLGPLIWQVAQLGRESEVMYVNTPKALVVGALASAIARRPLVYHLHDILSAEHFSAVNLRLAVTLANRFATLVIANSHASQAAFAAAGGRTPTQVAYNGFELATYAEAAIAPGRQALRAQLNLTDQFVVGHFSRLSPWKGQHVLIEALPHCPETIALFVGEAFFGEQDYVASLHQRVEALGLGDRVRFLGFRSDIPALMRACDVVAHTSIAPEPFGRVIVEAMLCGTPVIAAAAGGALELVTPGKTGWLVPPNDPLQLAALIEQCRTQPDRARAVAQAAQSQAQDRFDVAAINAQIDRWLQALAA